MSWYMRSMLVFMIFTSADTTTSDCWVLNPRQKHKTQIHRNWRTFYLTKSVTILTVFLCGSVIQSSEMQAFQFKQMLHSSKTYMCLFLNSQKLLQALSYEQKPTIPIEGQKKTCAQSSSIILFYALACFHIWTMINQLQSKWVKKIWKWNIPGIHKILAQADCAKVCLMHSKSGEEYTKFIHLSRTCTWIWLHF